MAKKPTPKKKPAKRGPKPKYDPKKVIEHVCQQMTITGRSVRAILKEDKGMPGRTVFMEWLADAKHQELANQYAQAMQSRWLNMADELVEISDDDVEDVFLDPQFDEAGNPIPGMTKRRPNNVTVQRHRLRVDTRKWVLSKMLPRVYGDKIQQEVSGPDGGPVEMKETTDSTVLARKLAFILTQGAEENTDGT